MTILALALLGLTVQTGAQMQPPTVGPGDGSPNFDIRVVKEGSRDYMERVGTAPLAGELARERIAGRRATAERREDDRRDCRWPARLD